MYLAFLSRAFLTIVLWLPETEGKFVEEMIVSVLCIHMACIAQFPCMHNKARFWTFIYLVHQGATTWFLHCLMNVKGVNTLAGTLCVKVQRHGLCII
jgi:hypothetical protein